MSTMVSIGEQVALTERPVLSVDWCEAGFERHDAHSWRQAGWGDAKAAARWRAACPDDTASHLSRMREAGYTLDQLRSTGRWTRCYVAAWAAAILPPAERGTGSVRPRPLSATVDTAGNTVIDLR